MNTATSFQGTMDLARTPALYTVDSVERVTTLNKRTILRLVEQGKFPAPVELPGTGVNSRRRAWRGEDIFAWLNALPTAPHQAIAGDSHDAR